MKKIISVFITLLAVIILSGCGKEEPPVKVELQNAYNPTWGYYYPKITLTSLIDNVEVQNVIVNKGNCEYKNEDLAYENGQMKAIKLIPKKLSFGKQLEVRLKSCKVLEVGLETDHGDFSFKFQ